MNRLVSSINSLFIMALILLVSHGILGAQYIREFDILPPNPLETDSITISIFGENSATNIQVSSSEYAISGDSIRISLDFSKIGFGYDVITPFETSVSIGLLTPGYYTVFAQSFFMGQPFDCGDFTFQIRLKPFTHISTQLTEVDSSSAAWGDYDNDGDLDILLTGSSSAGPISNIYRNESGSFVNVNAALTGVYHSSVAWGDYDNDGDLDILLTGSTGSSSVSKIYRNVGGSFVDINAALTGVSYSSVAWGDYDNDGDLDILLTGSAGSSSVSKIYRNVGGSFVDINAALTGVSYSSVAWGDYDNDGDLDILLTGRSSSGAVSKIYRNDGENFVDINAMLTGVSYSSVAWGDYDNDGDLDILLTGGSSGTFLGISKVYRNNKGSLLDINATLVGVREGSVAWGDFDNDGDLDILLSGRRGLTNFAIVYRNDGGSFADIGASLIGLYQSFATWGDYDKDNDLDILLTGRDSNVNPITKLYRNNTETTNSLPTEPTNLTASATESSVTLSWNKSTDNATVQNALTYNLRVGTTAGGFQKVSPMANAVTGYRMVSVIGNTNHNTSWTIKNLPEGTYFWSVQAIDNAFAGSQFATEKSIAVGEPPIVMHAPISPTEAGQEILVTATITDNIAVSNATLCYRKGGDVDFVSIPMSVRDGSYEGTISADSVTSVGIEYFISATDGVGLKVREPNSGFFSIRVIVPEPGVVQRNTQTQGSDQTAYRLFSVPLDLDNKSPNAVLDDDLGPYNIKKWRFYELGSDQKLQEFPKTGEMNSGKAFWLIVKDAGKIIDTGAGISNPTDKKFGIPLEPGWNFVGSPFNFRIPTNNLIAKSGQLVVLRSYKGNWNNTLNDPVTGMSPFEGYALFNNSSESDTLFVDRFLSAPSSSLLKETPIDSGQFQSLIRIIAQCQEARDEDNVAAFVASASNNWDDLDHPEPPVIGEYVSAYFPHHEWNTLAKTYCIDARPEPTDGEVWEFEVKTNIRDKVNLTFEGLKSVPSELEVWLTDDALRITQNLRESNHHAVAGFEQPKQLKLVVGKRNFVDAKLAEAQAIPDRYELFQNFPNPFNPVTTIRYGLSRAERVTLKVYNLLGEEVVTLADDEQKAAGYHTAIWDGQNKTGQIVASGVYIYTINTRGFTMHRKLVLMK